MLPNFFRRHRRTTENDSANNSQQQQRHDVEIVVSNDIESQLPLVEVDDDEQEPTRRREASDRALLHMAQNHMVAFVLTLYAIYVLGRLMGWKPGATSTTYTIYFSKESQLLT